MPTYEYQALNQAGKALKGLIDGENERAARATLRSQGLIVTNLKNPSASKSKTNNTSLKSLLSMEVFKSKIQTTDLMLFTRQLATLVASGMPIEEALKLISQQAENKKIHLSSSQIRQKISEGMHIAQAMEFSSLKFPKDYISTIAAGEQTGHMTEVLLRLADEVEHQAQSRQALTSALIYPAVMILVSISVVILLIVYVVPQIANVFSSLKQDLPIMTRFLIGMSNFLGNYGIYILLLIISAIILFTWKYNSNTNFRFSIHKKLFSIPVIGGLILASEISRWSRSLGMLLSSGVPSLQAMRIATNVVNNIYLKDALDKVNEMVREGQSFNLSLKKFTIIPSFVVHMTSSGESSGNLDEMILKISSFYEQFLKLKTSTTLKLIEPILIVVMGGVITMIVMAILLPIFQLNQIV